LATPSPPRVTAGRSAWVVVSVATVWRSPSAPRAVDAPGLRAPAEIRGWLAGMSLEDRRGLVDRADAQALLGDRVVVTAVQGSWAKVVVPDQPTPLDARGYPGWVPVAQLAAAGPEGGRSLATVVARTAWLRSDTAAQQRVAEVSYGTRLPVLGAGADRVRVSLPGARVGLLERAAVSVHPSGSPALSPTGPALVRAAQAFTGLPYLWAGRSGFGLDCSGLTSLVYRAHGVTIPRDADAQAAAGRSVSTSAREPGDLLFYATPSGYVHHVSMDAGGGVMVQSPATGKAVETIPVTTDPYAAEYAGARRYLR
jgi:cell wall-associated NlpC family hydrolase